MSEFTVVVDSRAARRMLGKYEPREMHNRLRRGTRAGGATYRTAIRATARSRGDIPDFFAKTRTLSSASMRSGIVTRVRPRSPLLSIFEGGADTHEIAPRRGMLLAGPAGKRGRKRAFLASLPVTHPGVSARPFLHPVFSATTPAAKRVVATTVFGESSLAALGFEVEDAD